MNLQIATFRLGGTWLGVDILVVKEIYRHMAIAPIPGAPPHFRGLMNLRGRVVTVIDLSVCLNRPPREEITDGRLLILKTDPEIDAFRDNERISDLDLGEDIVGLLIDGMDDVLDIDESAVLPAPSNLEEVEEGLIEGVVKRGDELVIILDVNSLLKRILAVSAGSDARGSAAA